MHAFGCRKETANGIWFLPYTVDTPIPNSVIVYGDGQYLTAMCLYVFSDFALKNSHYIDRWHQNYKGIGTCVGTDVTPDCTKSYFVGTYGLLDLDLPTDVAVHYGVTPNGDVDDECDYTVGSKVEEPYSNGLLERLPYNDPLNSYLFNADYMVYFISVDSHANATYHGGIEASDFVDFYFQYLSEYLDGYEPITYSDYVFDFYCHESYFGTDYHYTFNVSTGEVYREGVLVDTLAQETGKATELRFINSRGNSIARQLLQYDNQNTDIQCNEVEIVSVDCHLGYDSDGNVYVLDSGVYKPGKYWFKTMKLLQDANGWHHIGYAQVHYDNSVTDIYMDSNYELYNKNISHYNYGYVIDKIDMDGQPVFPVTGTAPNFDSNLFANHGLRDIDFREGKDWNGNKIYHYSDIVTAGTEIDFVFNKEAIDYGISHNPC